MNFAKIKRNYEKGLWSLAMVRMAVKKGIISVDEYTEITGESYTKQSNCTGKTVENSQKKTPAIPSKIKRSERCILGVAGVSIWRN